MHAHRVSILSTVRPRIWKPRIWKKPRLWKNFSDYRFLFNKITPNLEIFEKMGTPDLETFLTKIDKKWEKMAFLGEIWTIFVLAKMHFSM